MTEDDKADLSLLSGASPNRRIGVPLVIKLPDDVLAAITRSIDNQWMQLVDLAHATAGPRKGELIRWFRLTDAGMARLAKLKDSQPRN